MENVFEFLTDLSVLSSTGLIGSAFSFLGDSADWAGAVADLIGLLG
ncbi:PorA family porin [Corynebacterium glutamicum]|nr:MULTISPECIES: PorA family porin [Corynebacterium]ALP51103.1 porin [Corynebacterium glutamicum]ANR63582.1 porin [[Brevibacterium] flavum ZL-1]ANR66589.1 porin [Corynebacterium glutamicum ZL-6]ANU34630.1 porin [Corynebacterium glutamicum]APT08382.1 porin [Corynebacterium glutamicum]